MTPSEVVQHPIVKTDNTAIATARNIATVHCDVDQPAISQASRPNKPEPVKFIPLPPELRNVRFTASQSKALLKMLELAASHSDLTQEARTRIKREVGQLLVLQNIERTSTRLKVEIGHLLKGDLSFTDLGIYVTILLQADYRTGQWWGSAPRLAATGTRGVSLRAVQRSLEQLQCIGMLRVFYAGNGTRGNYGVLINKYEPTLGRHVGKRLDATASPDYCNPVYVDAEDALTTRCGVADESLSRRSGVADHAPSQHEDCRNEKENEKGDIKSNAIAIGSYMPNHSHLQKQRENTVIELTRYFREMVENNPHSKAVPQNWESLWSKDISALLRSYSEADLRDIIRASQTTRWCKYVIRGGGLRKMADKILAELGREAEKLMSTGSEAPVSYAWKSAEQERSGVIDSSPEEYFNVEDLDPTFD